MSTDKGFLGWDHYRECRRCMTVSKVDVGGTPSPPGGCPSELDTALMAVGQHQWRDVPEGDMGLLRYLWKKKHSTPFEMGGLTIEVQAPIFVFREWHRHRVPFGYSELSARYTPMPNLNYVPTLERCFLGGGHLTKQAGTAAGAGVLTDEAAIDWLDRLERFYDFAEELYQYGLAVGLPKELARIVVPVGRYSRMRATGNLRGWLGFLALRAAPDAQYEIRIFAGAIGRILAEEFPRTWELFREGEP
jgi:thymidylate synthase (FAD)